MGILSALESVLIPSKQKEYTHVDLKEIFCKKVGDDFIRKFNTAVVGAEYSNPDSSDRQKALKELKSGDRVRLVWHSGGPDKKDVVYAVRQSRGEQISMPDCFGRLNDKAAADVIRWLNRENIVTAAIVHKITGGTRKRPTLGCVLELRTYPGPDKKK